MRYQIYEAKSVKYDAQQRVRITSNGQKHIHVQYLKHEVPFDSNLITPYQGPPDLQKSGGPFYLSQ